MHLIFKSMNQGPRGHIKSLFARINLHLLPNKLKETVLHQYCGAILHHHFLSLSRYSLCPRTSAKAQMLLISLGQWRVELVGNDLDLSVI